MFRYFTHNNTRRYLDILNDLLVKNVHTIYRISLLDLLLMIN